MRSGALDLQLCCSSIILYNITRIVYNYHTDIYQYSFVFRLSSFKFSRDGITWTRVNYEQGNGVRGFDTFVQYFSSQEWSYSIVDSKAQYLGMWGSSTVLIDNKIILIAGDKTGAGSLQSDTYVQR